MDSSIKAGPATDRGAQAPSFLARNPWFAYVAPMAAYLLLTSAESLLPTGAGGGPHPVAYPIAYAIKAAAVLVVMILCRSTWADLRQGPARRIAWVDAVALGLAVTVVWIGADAALGRMATALGVELPSWLGGLAGRRMAYDPSVLPPAGRAAFITVRMLGLVLLVPVFEELFWRSFLMRFVIDPDDFTRVPIGRVTLLAAAVTSGGFAAAHPEWLPALLTGLAWAWLLHRTRSVAACAVSHAVANLGLGIYILATGEWRYW